MDPKYRLICYNTLGTSSLGKTSDPNELKKYCDMAPAGKPRNLCVIGTILSYTDRYGGNPTKLFGMFDFCAEVDTEYKFHCYNKIGLALQEWLPSENDQKDACNLVVDQEYKELCLNPNWDRPQELFNVDVETPKKIDTEPLSEQDSTLYLALKTKEACNDFNRPQLLNKEICYSKKFEDISFNGGPDYAYKVLFELQELDPEALGCHFIGHGIGYGAYKQNPEGWQNQINNINPACGYGSVHGTIERYVDNLPEGKFTKGMLPTLCGSNPRADCNHIIGHLTLVEVNANVDAGLDMCLIFEDDYQRSFCLTGIFMEYQTAFNLISHGLAPRSWLNWPARVDELEKLCRSYKGENATACWKEISHAALVKFNHDPYKIFEFCNSAQVWEGAGLCKRHSLGIMNAGVNYDLNSLRYVCQIEQPLNDPTFEHDCYMTLVSSKIYTLPPEKVKDTVSFCLSINPEFQSVCFTQIGLALNAQSTSMEMIEEICSSAPAEFKSNCLFGLGIKTQTT